ncbi:MAG: HAD family hydrolase [Cyclobacteriaceae bacterium]
MNDLSSTVKIIAFDADDTLWENETYFAEAEQRFSELLEDFLPKHTVLRELLHTEISNLPLYGYGIKAFMLSMIETAIRISDKNIPASVIQKTIDIGREMLDKPVVLLEGVEDVLKSLKGRYRLVLATKGDLLDQERKLIKSNLQGYFHHIEIMSEKKEDDYRKLIRRLDIAPEGFMMIGNSLKSDVMPVINVGGYGVHIPFHTTWAHEKIDVDLKSDRFIVLQNISEVPDFFPVQ